MPLSRKIILDSGNGQTFNEPWERIAGNYTAQVGDRLLLDARTTSPRVLLPYEGIQDGDVISFMAVRESGNAILWSPVGIDSGRQAVLSATDLAFTATYSGNDGKWLIGGASFTYKANFPAIYSQSSVYGGFSATEANMTDGNGGTGAGTNSAIGAWIAMELPLSWAITSVRVGGGTISGWGSVSAHLNDRKIQTSLDGTNWTDRATISGVADSGGSQFVSFPLGGVIAKHIRLITTGDQYLSTSEFWAS